MYFVLCTTDRVSVRRDTRVPRGEGQAESLTTIQLYCTDSITYSRVTDMLRSCTARAGVRTVLVPLHLISMCSRISSTGILTDFAWMQSGHFGILNSEFSETACMPGFDRGVTGRSGH